MSEPKRCGWAGADALMQAYHDQEWGTPQHDDRVLFEFLLLEGAQAGLSWSTILNKRENYRKAFHGFDPRRIAQYGERDRERLLADAGIVRNRLKIASAIGNAQAYLGLCERAGSLDAWLWGWVDGKPLVNRPRTFAEVPARTALSDRISKDAVGTGLQVRRQHDRLRVPAGRGRGRRPRAWLLPLRVSPSRPCASGFPAANPRSARRAA